MLYEFELGHIAMEATKNVCCAKSEGAIDYSNEMVQEISFKLQSGKVE